MNSTTVTLWDAEVEVDGRTLCAHVEAEVCSTWDAQHRCGESRVSYDTFRVLRLWNPDTDADVEVAFASPLERALFDALEGALLAEA